MSVKYQQIVVGQDRLFAGITRTSCDVISTQGQILSSFKFPKSRNSSFYSTALHEDLGIIVICGEEATVRAYRVKDGCLLWERQFKPSVYRIFVVPDEDCFVIVCEGGNHPVFARDGNPVKFALLEYHSYCHTKLGLIAVQNVTARDVIYFYRTKKVEQLLWPLHKIAAAASYKDKIMALYGSNSSYEKVLCIGKLSENVPMCQVEQLGIVALSFGLDGDLLVACRCDADISILSVNGAGAVKTLFRESNRELGWAFSGDGKYLIGRCGIIIDTLTFSQSHIA